jgi:hypothetical protein
MIGPVAGAFPELRSDRSTDGFRAVVRVLVLGGLVRVVEGASRMRLLLSVRWV